MTVAYLAVFAVCFLASLLGPLCGIGGGVIIKPVTDALGIMPVAAVSFLSSCSVLTMAVATLLQNAARRESSVDVRRLLPIACGSAAGGVVGKLLFNRASSAFPNPELVGAVQAIALIALAVLVLVYTLHKDRITSHRLERPASQACIGLLAGAAWAFLGIGGGPFNLAILAFFFSMDSKLAAQASLFIIAFSQTASLLYSVLMGGVPPLAPIALAGACAAAVAGSVVGRRCAKRMDARAVDRLYLLALLLIIAISLYNAARFSGI